MTVRSLRRSPQALWRRAGSNVLATLPEADGVEELGGAAAAVWLGLEEPTGTDALIGLLAEVYEMEAATIAADVEAAVDQLVRVGLLEAS